MPLKLIGGDSDVAIISSFSSSSSLFDDMWGSCGIDIVLVCSPNDQTAARDVLLLSLLGGLLVPPSVAVRIDVVLCSRFFMRGREWSNVPVNSRLGIGVIVRVAAGPPPSCVLSWVSGSPQSKWVCAYFSYRRVFPLFLGFFLIFSEISFNFLWCLIESSIFLCADWLLVSMS